MNEEERDPLIDTEVVVETVTGISLYDYGIAAGIFILFIVFRKIFTRYLFRVILKYSDRAKTDVLHNILMAFKSPLQLFFVIIGIYLALLYLPLPDGFNQPMIRIFRTLVIIMMAWGLFNLSSTSSTLFVKVGRKLDIELDQILLPFLSKLVRFAIVAMALSIIASEWGYDVNGFVAGLGLGGLAFALAAQNTLSNFFGGVVIITEKPFTIGDWISSPSVEGIVEDITFRSTKIRTFAHSLVVVPNATLANEPIQNWSKMGKRQITFKLGVTYSTSRDKMETCVDRIKMLLRESEHVDQELILVRFESFGQSSLDIFVYFFTKTTAWEEYLEIKEQINLDIMRILEEEGVQIAFPTRSLHVKHEEVSEEKKHEFLEREY
ncbi:mechanosensitive ion channel family protein [Alteribacter keqinensis]|uniref:Mechanosensitive ion channel family protein n=1 Tax=Alteribacter keqinensis TaxID=2483800 RepID=A0A3M7TVW5_9BACI|nr:mechanosensitive ion channel family protein [Alteribacter keqinensis]RNA69820.1 mechanosensitive ion channel family protein [Alteribacter keqinensis]